MAWTEAATGSTLMDGTEQTLSSQTTTGDYVLYLDLNAMASGDRIELRIYVTPKTGATERLLYSPANGGVFTDAQETPLWVTIPVSIIASATVKFTLKQTTGTNRTIIWWLDTAA